MGGNFKITTGGSVSEKKWETVETTWVDFVTRCRTPKRTGETTKQYARWGADNKTKRLCTRAKDVGGFVGGTLTTSPGARKKDNIAGRTLVTLDADTAAADFKDRVAEALEGVAAVGYTTHSHTAESPRWRVVIPLSREVSPDEGEVLSRMAAERIGAQYFDTTTHQRERLFFWPSVSCDGLFDSFELEGLPMDADAAPGDPADTDRAERAKESKQKGGSPSPRSRATPPQDKKGIVGAFCRVYTVADAITRYLSHVYAYDQRTGKYTYLGGSTVNGGCVFEDGAFYSHHSTDPAGKHPLNAFDLVRVHLYGTLDAEAKPETPINKLPSYMAMQELCREDDRVRVELMKSRMSTVADFSDMIDPADLSDTEPGSDASDWMKKLHTTKNGSIDPRKVENFHMILLNAPEFSGVRYDLFACKDVDLNGRYSKAPGEEVTEEGRQKMRVIFERYGLKTGGNTVSDAMTATRTERGYHPVRDYLDALKWDGFLRVETLLSRFLGADDSNLNREVIKCFMVAAVARVYDPGCKFDNVLLLCGPEGTGKSSFFRVLFSDRYFGDSLSFDQNAQQRYESIAGYWCNEIAEMMGYSRKESSDVKNYLSKQRDRLRRAYGKGEEDFPRQCVFCMTTNEDFFLKDIDEGNRRFWVVPVPGLTDSEYQKWCKRLEEERDQIFAEAVNLYRRGAPLELSREAREEMRRMHAEHAEVNGDPMREDIERWVYCLSIGDVLHWRLFQKWMADETYKRNEFNNYDFSNMRTVRKFNQIIKSLPGVKDIGARYIPEIGGKQKAYIKDQHMIPGERLNENQINPFARQEDPDYDIFT